MLKPIQLLVKRQARRECESFTHKHIQEKELKKVNEDNEAKQAGISESLSNEGPAEPRPQDEIGEAVQILVDKDFDECVKHLKKAILDGRDVVVPRDVMKHEAENVMPRDRTKQKDISRLPVVDDIDIWCLGVPLLVTYQVLGNISGDLNAKQTAQWRGLDGWPVITEWIRDQLYRIYDHDEAREMRPSLARLDDDPVMLGRLTEMLRSGLVHPTRQEILLYEPDSGVKGKLQAAIAKGKVDGIVFSMDRFFCLKKLQTCPSWGSPLSLARTWDVVLPGANVRNALCEKLNTEMESIVMEALFVEIDFDRDQTVSIGELREMLRIVLSRPLLASILLDLVEADVLMTWTWPAALLEQGITVRRVATDVIPEAIKSFARDAPQIVDHWCLQFDRNHDQIISKPEFCDLFLLSFDSSILHPLRNLVLPMLKKRAHQLKLQTLTGSGYPEAGESGKPEGMSSIRMQMRKPFPIFSDLIDDKVMPSCATGRDGKCLLSNFFQETSSREETSTVSKSLEEGATSNKIPKGDSEINLDSKSRYAACRPPQTLQC